MSVLDGDILGMESGGVADYSALVGALRALARALPFRTEAEAEAATVAAVHKEFRTLGRTAEGDGGGIVWVRATAEPAAGPKLRTVDRFLPDGTVSAGNGGWWRPRERDLDLRAAGLSEANTAAANSTALASAAAYVGAWKSAWVTAAGITVPPGGYPMAQLLDAIPDDTGDDRWAPSFRIWGSGEGVSRLYLDANLSAGSPMMEFGPDAAARLGALHMRDLTLDGAGYRGDGIHLTHMSKVRMDRVRVVNLFGTSLRMVEVWDSVFNDLYLHRCGVHPSITLTGVTGGPFVATDVITGGTSGVTARLASDSNFAAGPLYVGSERLGCALDAFTVGETITGSVSGATATVASYDDGRPALYSHTRAFDVDEEGGGFRSSNKNEFYSLHLEEPRGWGAHFFGHSRYLTFYSAKGHVAPKTAPAEGPIVYPARGIGLYLFDFLGLDAANANHGTVSFIAPDIEVSSGSGIVIRSTGGDPGTGADGFKVIAGTIHGQPDHGVLAECCKSLLVSGTHFRACGVSAVAQHENAHGLIVRDISINPADGGATLDLTWRGDSYTNAISGASEIQSGAITAMGGQFMPVDAEGRTGSSPDTLTTINGGVGGMELSIGPASSSRDIIVQDRSVAGGNITLPRGFTTITLTKPEHLRLQYNKQQDPAGWQVIGGDYRKPPAGSKTWNPPSLADGETATTTVPLLNGDDLADGIEAVSFSRAGFYDLGAVLSSTGFAFVALTNRSGGTLDLAEGTLRVWTRHA